jgi:hypothetical protein
MKTEKQQEPVVEGTETNKEKEREFILNGGLWNVMVQQSWPAVAAVPSRTRWLPINVVRSLHWLLTLFYSLGQT